MCTTVAKWELDARSRTVMFSVQHKIRYQEHLNHCDLDHLCWAAAQPQITHTLLLLVLSAEVDIFGPRWCDVVSRVNLFISAPSFWRYYVHLIPDIRSKSLTRVPRKNAGERPNLPPEQQSCSWAVWQTPSQCWHLAGGEHAQLGAREGGEHWQRISEREKNWSHYLQHKFMIGQEKLKCLEAVKRCIPWRGKHGVSSTWQLKPGTGVSKLSELSEFLWSSKRWVGAQ